MQLQEEAALPRAPQSTHHPQVSPGLLRLLGSAPSPQTHPVVHTAAQVCQEVVDEDLAGNKSLEAEGRARDEHVKIGIRGSEGDD